MRIIIQAKLKDLFQMSILDSKASNSSNSSKQIEVFYDTRCPSCRALARWMRRQDKQQCIQWRSLAESERDARLNTSLAKRKLPVIDETGRVYYGFAGLIRIMESLSHKQLPIIALYWILIGLKRLHVGRLCYGIFARMRCRF